MKQKSKYATVDFYIIIIANWLNVFEQFRIMFRLPLHHILTDEMIYAANFSNQSSTFYLLKLNLLTKYASLKSTNQKLREEIIPILNSTTTWVTITWHWSGYAPDIGPTPWNLHNIQISQWTKRMVRRCWSEDDGAPWLNVHFEVSVIRAVCSVFLTWCHGGILSEIL